MTMAARASPLLTLAGQATVTFTIRTPTTTTVHGVPTTTGFADDGTITGRLQPASDQALTRLGLQARSTLRSAYLAPGALNPAQRLQQGGVTYAILDLRTWPGHTEALLEEVDA